MLHYFFYKVNKTDIAKIKFLLEAYENIFTVSTIDKELAKIQITLPKDFLDDAKDILTDLKHRFYMEPLEENPKKSQGRY